MFKTKDVDVQSQLNGLRNLSLNVFRNFPALYSSV
jgi:hypothetical protein